MFYNRNEYLKVGATYDNSSVEIKLDKKSYHIHFPLNIWAPLEDTIKESILDHIAFLSTNYLPLITGHKGIIYDTRLPMFDSFSFKSMILDMPSSAILDGFSQTEYIRRYLNLDFKFIEDKPRVWSRNFQPKNRAIISFTSGKESLLTLALCLEMGIEPILINIVEPSNIHENKHKIEILKGISEEFNVKYHIVPQEIGLFHDANHMELRPTSLGWGNQLMYYLFIYLPFLFHYKASYILYGNEYSCDEESINGEGYRSNFCYDQSSHWTNQMDLMLRTVTDNSGQVGSLVGPLNELAVIKTLHQGFPKLAKYQMSCFCEDPVTLNHRWCCKCSKCARNYAFIKAVGADPSSLGFWQDMFTEEYSELYSAFEGKQTYGFDKSGLGKKEQELALFMASEKEPDNIFLKKFKKSSIYNHSKEKLKKDKNFYLKPQNYLALPDELKMRVYKIFNRILGEL